MNVATGDGGSLAVWVYGDGPPLVLVHGAMQDHSANRPFAEALADRVTTFSMDRRGFGASLDTLNWSMDREFADVVTVVDAAAASTGEPVALWGHSFGASIAMGAAARSQCVSHLVLYEPSLGPRYPPAAIDSVEAALAAGDPDRAISEMLRRALELTDEDIEAMRSSPTWPSRVAAAATVPRECRAEDGWEWPQGQFDDFDSPTLLLTGSDSPSSMKAATDAAAMALGHPSMRVLDGHGHFAIRTDPVMVAEIVLEFLRSDDSTTTRTVG